jgi:16S rRNA (guanine(527)-N(7))-methyltransferase RsmG
VDARSIAELLEPFLGAQDPTPNIQELISHISTYIDLLLRWNARINLTAIRDPEEIVTRHFGESLFAARHLFPNRTSQPLSSRPKCVGERSEPTHAVEGPWVPLRTPLEPESRDVAPANQSPFGAKSPQRTANNQRPATNDRISLADIGSGPGLPGLPIKLWAPDISLTLIESNQKKATFLKEVTRALTLTDVDIQTVRAESLPPATFDVVTLRAVERFDQILPTAARLTRPQGRLALLIGSAQLAQAKSTLPTVTWHGPLPIPVSKSRILLTGSQIRQI